MINNYILVVDDDPNIRAGLAKEIEKEFKGKANILTCKNGAIAAELLKCNTIDIVVTDIKMPVMNGIELLQFINDNQIICKSIVLSSYDDFNLVRDAMRLGAYDYLLKPVNFPSLHQILHKLLAQAVFERDSSTNNLAIYNSQELLENFLQNPRVHTIETMAFEEKYALTKSSPCIIGSAKIDYPHASKLYQTQEALRKKLYTFLSSANISYKTILTGEFESCFVFLLFPEDNQDDFLSILNDFINQMQGENQQFYLYNSAITLDECSIAFQHCLTKLELNYYDLPYDESYTNYDTDDLTKIISSAVNSLSIYDISETLHSLTRFFAIINHLKPPITDAKKYLSQMIYNLIRSNPKFIEPLSKSKFTEHDIFNQIESSKVISTLKKELFSSLNFLISEVINTLPNKTDCVIEKAVLYIERNYNDFLSLSDVAAHVYLNKNYFSSLFKNKMGVTYTDYLRNYRIEKAICLIRESNLKLYEIAQSVGYSDSAQFSRAFKEVTGSSPSDYKS